MPITLAFNMILAPAAGTLLMTGLPLLLLRRRRH
jgi:LPXTG-motif cell wall-anchored protein